MEMMKTLGVMISQPTETISSSTMTSVVTGSAGPVSVGSGSGFAEINREAASRAERRNFILLGLSSKVEKEKKYKGKEKEAE